MNFDFGIIHIGKFIEMRVVEIDIDLIRICNFFGCPESGIKEMYQAEHLDCGILLKWSKLLEYDFFRIYSQHLVLYAPQRSIGLLDQKKKSVMPQFRKNLYTREIISFMLELVTSGKKTKQEIIDEYKIPKTTLYKWIDKYK